MSWDRKNMQMSAMEHEALIILRVGTAGHEIVVRMR